ncbi:MAG: hypothetical protein ABIE74_02920 [Pseudomonadota bacterium]
MPKKNSSLDTAVAEDPLIQGLLEAKGKRVEVIAFGIAYQGTLQQIDPDEGTVVIVSGDDRATLELERIESLCILKDNGE